jgi:hypothetical protein
MDDDIDILAAAIGAQFDTDKPAFDLAKEDLHVLDALTTRTAHLETTLTSLRDRVPLPRSSAPTIEGRFYRLPGHNRSFCYSLRDSVPISRDSPVLVFKGTEPLLPDFSSMLDWMAQSPLRKSSRVMADHFPLAEGKIPGALSLKEAMGEARIALQIQRRHLLHYGELARLPTPLLVHTFPESRRSDCAAKLRAKLSGAAFERIQPLLQSGLAIYIYYYPSAPIRANYLGEMGAPQFRKLLTRQLDEGRTINDWVRLLVRLLYLGYLPYTVRNEGLGACMDFGNAALDGGFCDPDSIVEINSSPDAEFFREAIIQSLALLQNTVQLLLGLSYSGTLYPSIEQFVCRGYLYHLFDEALESERRPGLHLDPRVRELMRPRSLADVRSCTERKIRLGYAQFAKQHKAQVQRESQQDEYYP